MTLRNRVAAFVLTLLFVFVMLFSQFFIIAEAEHDCIGEHCPVCEQIAVCENALKTLSNGVAAIIALLTCVVSFDTVMLFADCYDKSQTPVSLKVRLLN